MNECCTRNHIYLDISWYLHFIFSLQGCLTVSQAILYKNILCLINLQRNVKLKLVFYVPNLLQCEQWLEIKLDMSYCNSISHCLGVSIMALIYKIAYISQSFFLYSKFVSFKHWYGQLSPMFFKNSHLNPAQKHYQGTKTFKLLNFNTVLYTISYF